MQSDQALTGDQIVRREAVSLAIPAPWAAGECISIALDVYHPPEGIGGALLFCIPGGGVNRAYFDMKVEGAPQGFATEMATRGHLVIAADPPGVGESTRPLDGFVLTPDVVAECLHLALAEFARMRPECAGRLPIGIGHSAGAMLAAIQQARHEDFAALMLLCFGTIGLPELVTDVEQVALAAPDRGRSQLAALARQRFSGQAYADIPLRPSGKGGEALRKVWDKVLAIVALQAMLPGNVAPELARIDVPVMLAAGDRDMTGPPHQLPVDYPSCRDLYLHVVPMSGHHIFLAEAAPVFYERAGLWLRGLSRG